MWKVVMTWLLYVIHGFSFIYLFSFCCKRKKLSVFNIIILLEIEETIETSVLQYICANTAVIVVLIAWQHLIICHNSLYLSPNFSTAFCFFFCAQFITKTNLLKHFSFATIYSWNTIIFLIKMCSFIFSLQ